ncbi:MAG TPA: zinc-binding dehydrogenase, partial [Candidatus Binataceae bacterium]|nr:zinc-binding dehydrogenase [Candidatus Binataceae bacterium]
FTVPGPSGGIFEFRDITVPTAGVGEVLIKVRASGTNRGELLARPLIRSDNPALRPTRSGSEFAGEIASLGSSVARWSVGDRVMGRAPGSYAEYVVANQRALMRIPSAMAWAEAASIPNVFVTAHDAIVTNARTQRGESVMITAGSSGVGTAAIQIARHLGANLVLATSRSLVKRTALLELGAHEVIDASRPAWVDEVVAATGKRGIDVIIDNVGGPMLAGNIRALAIKGRLVSVGRNAGQVGDCNLDEVARKRVSIIGVTFRTRSLEESLVCGERFAADLLGAFSDGALRPVLDRTFPFDRIADAHAYMLSDAQIGKIVVTMD